MQKKNEIKLMSLPNTPVPKKPEVHLNKEDAEFRRHSMPSFSVSLRKFSDTFVNPEKQTSDTLAEQILSRRFSLSQTEVDLIETLESNFVLDGNVKVNAPNSEVKNAPSKDVVLPNVKSQEVENMNSTFKAPPKRNSILSIQSIIDTEPKFILPSPRVKLNPMNFSFSEENNNQIPPLTNFFH